MAILLYNRFCGFLLILLKSAGPKISTPATLDITLTGIPPRKILHQPAIIDRNVSGSQVRDRVPQMIGQVLALAAE